MKILLTFLFALLFCFNAVADNADRTKNAHNRKTLKNDIVIYQNELEKCDEIYEEKAGKAFTTAEMMSNIYDGINCYQTLAEKIIDEQYSKRAEDHKKALTAYIKSARNINGLVYETLDKCFPTGCGTASVVFGQDNTVQDIQEVVKRYIHILKAQTH